MTLFTFAFFSDKSFYAFTFFKAFFRAKTWQINLLLYLLYFSAAVPKSSHFGIFGILRHKLGLSGSKHKSRSQEHEAEDAYLPDQVLESPQVVRIKCEEGVDVESDMGSPLVIRRKVRAWWKYVEELYSIIMITLIKVILVFLPFLELFYLNPIKQLLSN